MTEEERNYEIDLLIDVMEEFYSKYEHHMSEQDRNEVKSYLKDADLKTILKFKIKYLKDLIK